MLSALPITRTLTDDHKILSPFRCYIGKLLPVRTINRPPRNPIILSALTNTPAVSDGHKVFAANS